MLREFLLKLYSKNQTHAKDKMWKRWWLFHATDFLSLMHPCFTFCRILGIFPYKMNASTFEASKPRYILMIVIICICCVFNFLFIHNIVIAKTMNFGDTTRNFEAISFYMSSSFIIIIKYILSGPQMRLLQTILEISSKLPSKSYQKLSRFIHVKDVLGTILIVVQMCVYFSKTPMFELSCLNVLIVLFTIYLEILVFQINMVYINCVCVLKTCFKSINDNLRHVQRLMVNDIQLSIHGLIRQKNQFLLIKLTILKKQHLTVSETVHMLNIIFNLQLLAIIILSFSEITFELYSYVVRWRNGISITLDWKLFDVLFASMVLYFLKITLLAWTCETAKNQAKEIGIIIHEMLNNTMDKQIKSEVIKLLFIYCCYNNVIYIFSESANARFLKHLISKYNYICEFYFSFLYVIILRFGIAAATVFFTNTALQK